jgi:hypothetical protein
MRIVGGDWLANRCRLVFARQEGEYYAMKAFLIFALAAVAAPALAQEASQASSNAPAAAGAASTAPPAAGVANASPAAAVDEVVVPGRKDEPLRVQIERLENSVYDRFNALNSNDEFDIHCFEQAPTGSNIPVRKCWPNFALEAEKRAAGKSLRRMQGVGGGAGNSESERASNAEKSKQLIAELQRVAREDEQLARDLTRLAQLKEVQPSDGDAASSAAASQVPGRAAR